MQYIFKQTFLSLFGIINGICIQNNLTNYILDDTNDESISSSKGTPVKKAATKRGRARTRKSNQKNISSDESKSMNISSSSLDNSTDEIVSDNSMKTAATKQGRPTRGRKNLDDSNDEIVSGNVNDFVI